MRADKTTDTLTASKFSRRIVLRASANLGLSLPWWSSISFGRTDDLYFGLVHHRPGGRARLSVVGINSFGMSIMHELIFMNNPGLDLYNVCHGRKPFGYRYEDAMWPVNPDLITHALSDSDMMFVVANLLDQHSLDLAVEVGRSAKAAGALVMTMVLLPTWQCDEGELDLIRNACDVFIVRRYTEDTLLDIVPDALHDFTSIIRASLHGSRAFLSHRAERMA